MGQANSTTIIGTNTLGKRLWTTLTSTLSRPQPEEPIELDPQVRIICPVGGIILFSGAQLHSAVPNTSELTRFSIDFRTVHLDDVVAKKGAPNIDSAATGTTLRDFLRGTDVSLISDDIIYLYDPEPFTDGELVSQPLMTEDPVRSGFRLDEYSFR